MRPIENLAVLQCGAVRGLIKRWLGQNSKLAHARNLNNKDMCEKYVCVLCRRSHGWTYSAQIWHGGPHIPRGGRSGTQTPRVGGRPKSGSGGPCSLFKKWLDKISCRNSVSLLFTDTLSNPFYIRRSRQVGFSQVWLNEKNWNRNDKQKELVKNFPQKKNKSLSPRWCRRWCSASLRKKLGDQIALKPQTWQNRPVSFCCSWNR